MKITSIARLAVLSGIFLMSMASCSTTPDSIQKAVVTQFLKVTVTALNKDCPKMIDKDIRLDSVTMPGDHMLTYNCALTNTAIEDLDTSVFRSLLEPELINTMKQDTDFQVFVDYDVTIAYHYTDKNSKNLTTVFITPDMYSNKPIATKPVAK